MINFRGSFATTKNWLYIAPRVYRCEITVQVEHAPPHYTCTPEGIKLEKREHYCEIILHSGTNPWKMSDGRTTFAEKSCRRECPGEFEMTNASIRPAARETERLEKTSRKLFAASIRAESESEKERRRGEGKREGGKEREKSEEKMERKKENK